MNLSNPKAHVERVLHDAQAIAFSDDRLALDFAEANKHMLRYIPAMGKWLTWEGIRWRFDELLSGRHRARLVCRNASLSCNQSKLSKLIASAKTISAVERLAQSDPGLVTTVEQWDADPWALNTPAGTIDLGNLELLPHDPNDYITKITGVAPNPECSTPLWDAFLQRITAGDPDLIRYLQRMAGYALTGVTREHALFFLYGTGSNGKSTFLNALIACLGDYHRAAPIETFTASNTDRHPTELASLRGARLVTSIETEEGRRWAESRIKALTGDDPIAARFMRQDFFEYRPQFKLLIAGNHKPGLRSVDEAIRRRFNLVPFVVTIPPQERDLEFTEKLKPELPGIMAWMLQGCAAWQAQGLDPPPAVTKATADYLAAEDAVAAWIDDRCQRAPNAFEPVSMLFASWSDWATKAGEIVGSQKRLLQTLETRGCTPHRKMHARGMKGLRLIPESIRTSI
jgi:putative DNA primase/helicase